jgi:hypothetical protein
LTPARPTAAAGVPDDMPLGRIAAAATATQNRPVPAAPLRRALERGRWLEMNVLRPVALALLTLFSAETARAHHAFSAEFDIDKPIKITGTVTKVEWQNPHTWFYLDVPDGLGAVTSWAIEMASPNLLMRAGWTRSSMKIGDVVTVDGFHAKDGSNTGNARSVVLSATGQTLLTGSGGGRAP